jgi:hypothetical protein
MDRTIRNTQTGNIVALSCLSLVEALQLLIIVALVFSFIPMSVPSFVQKLFPISQYDVHLKRDGSFYHLWVIAAFLLQGLLVFANRRHLENPGLLQKVLPYIATMAALVFVQIFAIFKIFLWGNPAWARGLLYAFIVVGALARIFWPELQRFVIWLWKPRLPLWVPETAAILAMSVLVFIPHLGEVLARMFSYDKFYHLDSFIMAPAWAHHQGLVLNRDVTSEYSLTIPIVFDNLMNLAGGFSYAHAVSLMIVLCALYYFLLYGLWRYWTRSAALSFFAAMLCLKLQFFHWGVIPLVWIYPSATPLRFLPDIFFLFFVLRFTQDLNLRWLVMAAAVNGLTLVWTVDVGVYLYAALLMAAAAGMYLSGRRILVPIIGVIVLPWVTALVVLSFFYGNIITQSHFWQNSFEFASLFLQGWGALPITEGLKDKQFFAFCMGFIIPLVYTGTLLYSLGTFLFRRSQPNMWMAIICVYGLGLYHYFIHRSGVTSYYAVIVPFIFVLLFWIKTFINSCHAGWQKAMKVFLCVWALTALVTSYLYGYYPNWLNLSAWNWAPEKKFYEGQFDFSRDASLIDALTKSQERVPLISSFETKILMQADRPPFFYYFPMMESEQMQGNALRGTYLHTYARLNRTLKQLKERKPLHVFIQTRVWEGAEAQSYENNHEGFKTLMVYIRGSYEYEQQGQYLTALKLK